MSCPFAYAQRPLARPPAVDASADEIVAWLLGGGHHSLCDEEGRPLGERASPLYEEAVREEQHRTFDDSRDATGLPCNVAALRQLKRAWPVLLDALATFEAQRPAIHRRLFRRAEAGSALAPLAALRPEARPPTRESSALFKVTLGFREVFGAALMEGRVDADAAPVGHELLDWLDERGFLIGDAQVCAGTRAQIRRAFDALAASRSSARDDLPECFSGLGALWFSVGLDALGELHALAASAAGAARLLLASGQLPEAPSHEACLALYTATDVPRMAEALRQTPNVGPLQVTLLFSASAVPESLRAFLDSVASLGPAASLRSIDAALVRAATPVAERLLRAVGREPRGPLTGEAFRAACVF